MGVKGYASTVIVTGIILTPFVAIIRDGLPFGVIALWVICISLAWKSNSLVVNSCRYLRDKYAENPGAYLPPKFVVKMGLVNLVPKKGVEIPKIYQMDRFICLAAQHVIVYDEKYRHLNIEKSNYSAVIKILSRGTYYVDNFGVYRKGNETVGEIPPGSQFDDRVDRKRIYISSVETIKGNFSFVKNPYWQRGIPTTAEKSKYFNYYNAYKYNKKDKKYYFIDNPIVTDENNKIPEADVDYR